MPSTGQLLAFLAVSLVLIVVPGPSVLFVVGRAVSLGRAAAVRTAIGNALGALVLVVGVAFGLGTLLTAASVSYTAIRLVGAAYLVFLGVQAIRHRRDEVAVEQSPAKRRVLAEGFVVGLTNPKTAVFFAAVLPQFIDPSRPAAVQLLFLGTLFVVLAAASDSLWGVFAGTARGWLGASPARLRRLRAAGGGVLVLLGLRLALSD